MDGKKKNFGRFLQCQGEDDSDRSIDGSRIQEPPFDLRNRSSRGLGAELNSTGLLTAGSHVWPSVFVPPPQQPPLARHPAAAPRRSHEEKLAQGQIIKLLAVQEKTRTLVRSISKQLPTADHRRLFHEDVVRQQLHMERQHQSLLKQRLLSVKRANSGSVIRQYSCVKRFAVFEHVHEHGHEHEHEHEHESRANANASLWFRFVARDIAYFSALAFH
ncbi:GL20369 [Drosophila persimilis]|uniref:GL20369 n=1 Tax=Drosophila persimilis TaxID=7234 RepID=B4GXY1_DROPE|nr:GL20369 [Drosophila persimilis]